jgi:hypothetical protein
MIVRDSAALLALGRTKLCFVPPYKAELCTPRFGASVAGLRTVI